MSLLRIYGSQTPGRCSWALTGDQHAPVVRNEGRLSDVPARADRVQLVLPADQVLLVRTRLPTGARRLNGSALAYAIEDQITGEPEASQVTWLGMAGEEDVLAAVDRQVVNRWRDALNAAGIQNYEIHCETLMLPRENREWSLAWNGREGYVRTGEFEGGATDSGDHSHPPLSLQLMLDEARKTGRLPAAIALHATAPDNMPDIEAWQETLGVNILSAGQWNWWAALPEAGVSLVRERRHWLAWAGTLQRLRPAAWILGAALVIHAAALVFDWASLAREQRNLRQGMEAGFRAAFPDTVAVVDPALQMRRKLAEARHAAGQSDSSDFLPMIDKAGSALKDLPAGSVRVLAYESGRMTVEMLSTDEAATRRIVARLQQSGLRVDVPTAAPVAAPSRSGSRTVVITARSS